MKGWRGYLVLLADRSVTKHQENKRIPCGIVPLRAPATKTRRRRRGRARAWAGGAMATGDGDGGLKQFLRPRSRSSPDANDGWG